MVIAVITPFWRRRQDTLHRRYGGCRGGRDSEAAAAAGAKAVVVDYAELPLITDPAKALEEGSPLVHDERKRAAPGALRRRRRGCDLPVEKTSSSWNPPIVPQCMDHAFLETEGGFAFPEDGGVRVISGGQNAYYNQQQVAPCLGLPMDKVRMVEPFSGGAFGGKGDVTVHIVVALAAWLTGRPCRMVWTRREHALAGVKRHPYQIRLRTAATRGPAICWLWMLTSFLIPARMRSSATPSWN